MHVTVDIVEAWEAGWGVVEVYTTEERGWRAENRDHISPEPLAAQKPHIIILWFLYRGAGTCSKLLDSRPISCRLRNVFQNTITPMQVAPPTLDP